MLGPNPKLVRVVDALSEPLSLALAKKFCRVDATVVVDDDLIAQFITAARYEAERITRSSFITTTWNFQLDYFPPGGPGSLGQAALLAPLLGGGGWSFPGRRGPSDWALQLPMPPLIEVQEIRYTDSGGASYILDPLGYRVSTGTPGQILPAWGSIWPLVQPGLSMVSVDFTAGYGADASFVPANVVTAMAFLTAHYYTNRTDNIEVPPAVMSLLSGSMWGSYC